MALTAALHAASADGHDRQQPDRPDDRHEQRSHAAPGKRGDEDRPEADPIADPAADRRDERPDEGAGSGDEGDRAGQPGRSRR